MSDSLKIIKDSEPQQPWYAKGLSFKCTECGQCCTGSPGYTWVSDKEIEEIAQHLQISIQKFCQQFLRWVDGRYALLEHPVNYDCIFLKNKKCQIYTMRPTQCRTYPWWPQNLSSEAEWQQAAAYCEGIQSEAPIVPLETIQSALEQQLEDGCFV